jgi:hypothetical protein
VAHPLQFHRKGWVAVAVAFAFAIAVACPFVCHSAAQRRNLLSPLLSPLLVLSPTSNPKSLVISTEATDSLIVCCAVERSPYFALFFPSLPGTPWLQPWVSIHLKEKGL